jgi:hypothetical protein
MSKEPTMKQMKAVQLAVENGGNISKAMRDAGYSPATAKNPDKLTKSVAWQELVEAYLPDEMILGALAEDIEAKKGNRTAELTLATKLKGRMVEKQDVTSGGEKLQPILVRFLGDEPADN